MTSRPSALAIGLFFFTVGYIVVAASQSVEDLAGGQVLYTIGNTGLNFGESSQPLDTLLMLVSQIRHYCRFNKLAVAGVRQRTRHGPIHT